MLFGTWPLDAVVLRRDCDADGDSGSGLPHSRMACFSVRSNASAPNRVAPGPSRLRRNPPRHSPA
jgi:hypothetical protein